MPKFAANLGFLWPDRPLIARIDAAAAAGFAAVELHWPYDLPAPTVRAACGRAGVRLLGINTPRGDHPGDFGLGAAPGRERAFRRGFTQAADYARGAGAGALHVMAGDIAPGGAARARATFLENLAWAAAVAPDLTLLLEPMNRIDRPAYFYEAIEEAADIAAAVEAPNVGVMFDAYHVAIGGADVIASLRANIGRVAHVQIAAAPSRAEPDEGDVDYRAVFAALDTLGYPGWVSCEYRPRAGTDAGLGWRAALGAAG